MSSRQKIRFAGNLNSGGQVAVEDDLVRRWSGFVLKTAKSLRCATSEGDDLSQDLWAKAFQSEALRTVMERGPEDRGSRAYVARTLRTLAIDLDRKALGRQRPPEEIVRHHGKLGEAVFRLRVLHGYPPEEVIRIRAEMGEDESRIRTILDALESNLERSAPGPVEDPPGPPGTGQDPATVRDLSIGARAVHVLLVFLKEAAEGRQPEDRAVGRVRVRWEDVRGSLKPTRFHSALFEQAVAEGKIPNIRAFMKKHEKLASGIRSPYYEWEKVMICLRNLIEVLGE